jgi:2-keto-4-pentenoate hydratase/2-oxohepta-3-ene-1,7-dioic acid hydratase in catechol pathway
MAKAACCVSDCGLGDSPGTVSVQYTVSVDNGTQFGAGATINFSRSTTQMLADIRASVIAFAAGMGVTLASGDIIVFGGPQ